MFKALADSGRRKLLDALFASDGQTLSALESCLPDMTRFGVMKHLRILEEAGLLVTVRAGREKKHYLNPAPIGDVYDRWVNKYAQPHLRILAGMKSKLENKAMTETKTQTNIIQTYIRATPQQVWDVMTNGEETEKFFFDTRLVSTLKVGDPFQYIDGKGEIAIDGVVLEIDPPTKLVCSFVQKWEGEAFEGGKVTYELTEMGEMTKVRLTHEGLPYGHPLVEATFGGWSYILSGLKTLIETGKRLETTSA